MIGTRDRVVDEFLEGGVPRKLITEVFGQSGSGKSQFAIQLSINTIVYLKQGKKIHFLQFTFLFVSCCISLDRRKVPLQEV